MTKSGGFDTDFITPGYEDRDFFLRLHEITEFHYLDMFLGSFYYDETHTPRWLANLLSYARKQWNNPQAPNSSK